MVSKCSIVSMVIVLFFLPAPCPGQAGDEKIPEYMMDEIVVVAERTQNLLLESTVATSVLTRATLENLPATSLADALRYVPGLSFIERDGSGNIPVAIVRGFYGGGESEYVLLTIDGVPVNDMRTGLADWNRIPINSIERIEVLRGGGSAVYGDMAVGAVVNVVTRKPVKERSLTSRLSFGEDGKVDTDLCVRMRPGSHDVHIRTHASRDDGYRDHADWENLLLAGGYEYALANGGSLRINSNLQRLFQKEPGPLRSEQVAENRIQSNPLFDMDYRRRDVAEAALGYNSPGERPNRLTADIGFRYVDQEQTRTLLLTPDMGDTQFHVEGHSTLWSHLQYRHKGQNNTFVSGVEAEYGRYDSEYFKDTGMSKTLSTGNGSRTKFGIYAEAQQMWRRRVKAMAGLRYDSIFDHFEEPYQGTSDVYFDRLSHHLGLNIAYLTGSGRDGHIYMNWTRSFKAPTLDQLFDRRLFPPGLFPDAFTISNEGLVPQRSRGIEVGIYQKVPIVKHRLSGEFTLSAYRIDLEGEIDFSMAVLKYVNIKESRHDGIESSITLYYLPYLSLNTSLNFMDVTFRSGDNEGNRLKLIPGKTVSTSLFIDPHERLHLTVTHTLTDEVYLDDSNSVTLPRYQTIDLKLRLDIKRVRFHFLVENIADEEYSSNGYLLLDMATFENVPLLYPARGRYIQGGISVLF
ncbi:MAG: TonB-dependent receptor [bacterium]|nr:MAG: TonB-dependent receptor [bacterium]